MSGLADSMIENGIAKRALFGDDKSMCLVAHAAFVFLSENGLYPITVWDWQEDEEHAVVKLVPFDRWTLENDDTQGIWNSIPSEAQKAIHDVIVELYPAWNGGFCPWEWNDDPNVTEDDILRVGKMVDERLSK